MNQPPDELLLQGDQLTITTSSPDSIEKARENYQLAQDWLDVAVSKPDIDATAAALIALTHAQLAGLDIP